jgi:hypothetical protein
MIAWSQHLTCSHAAIAFLVPVLIAGSLYCWRASRRRPQAVRVRRPQQPIVVDYSVARAKAIAWLGDRYLLAKSINRRVAR